MRAAEVTQADRGVKAAEVTPLDPDSPKGREVADRLNQVLAEIWVEIQQAKARRAATRSGEQAA